MFGPAEIIVHLMWSLFPEGFRTSIARKIVLLQSRARIALPVTPVTVYTAIQENAARFPDLPAENGGKLHERCPAYSLISTCRNERDSIEAWLDSIQRQSVAPVEAVICDGGSTDNTVQLIRDWVMRGERTFDVKVIEGRSLNIAQGRNAAAVEAREEILVLSDAGGTLDRNWAERLLTPFVRNPETDVSMGWYKPLTKGKLQYALSRFLMPSLDHLDPETFLPSGRSLAIRRECYHAVGGYPEHLTLAGEDSLFDFYLKTVAAKAAFVPDAVAFWRFPEGIAGAARTIFNYSRGDAESGFLFYDYYERLLAGQAKIGLELFAGLLLLSCGVVFFGCLFLLFALMRWTVLILSYGVASGRDKAGPAIRFLAVALLTTFQTAGFLRGLFTYREAEKRRIAKAERGHLVLMLPHFLLYRKNDPGVGNVLQLLAAGWYVTIVYARTVEEPDVRHYPFSHPQLESHLRSQFDADSWLEKHRPFFQGRERAWIDQTQDALSRELRQKLERAGFHEQG